MTGLLLGARTGTVDPGVADHELVLRNEADVAALVHVLVFRHQPAGPGSALSSRS